MSSALLRLPINLSLALGAALAVIDLESAAIIWLYGAGVVLGFGHLERRGIL